MLAYFRTNNYYANTLYYIGGYFTIYRQDISDSKLNLNAFKLFFVLALFLFLIITPILKNVLSEGSEYVIRIVGLTSLFSFFYCVYFIAKSIRNLETERNIKTSSLFLDFILIWILPIGIWIIQPRVNRILSYKEGKAQ
jgi:cell division protein FtsW (lipid II flippase)